MARPKGSPNKLPAHLKEMILQALEKAGGVDYLVKQADDNPSGFMTLLGKVLPLQVQGDADAPLAISVIERHIIKPNVPFLPPKDGHA